MNIPFSRTQFPPGGWQYFQAVTGWHAPTPKSSTFDQTVRLIIQMRQKNPAMVVKHNLSLDPFAVALDLEQYTKRRCGIVDPTPTALPSVLMPGVGTQLVSGVDEIKKMALGTALLLGWERSNTPAVDQETADYRATICASCPMNNQSRLMDWTKSQVGMAIKSKTMRIQREARKPKNAAELGLCEGLMAPEAFLCSMPLEGIVTKLKVSERDALHSSCWIRV